MSGAKSISPGARFAVVDFKDYPGTGEAFGDESDYPYQLRTPGFTADPAAVQTALNSLSADGGGDNPEAYNRVFFEAYSDPALLRAGSGHDPEALRLLVVLGDALPHDAHLHESFDRCESTPPTDPGPDGVVGTPDDLSSAGVLGGLKSHQIRLLWLSYDASLLPCQQQLAQTTGGDAVDASDASSVAALVNKLAAARASRIDAVNPLLRPTTCQFTVSFAPAPPYGPFAAPVDVAFKETVSVPLGTVPGLYTCQVTTVADGAERATQTVHVRVPVDPTPTATPGTLTPTAVSTPMPTPAGSPATAVPGTPTIAGTGATPSAPTASRTPGTPGTPTALASATRPVVTPTPGVTASPTTGEAASSGPTATTTVPSASPTAVSTAAPAPTSTQQVAAPTPPAVAPTTAAAAPSAVGGRP